MKRLFTVLVTVLLTATMWAQNPPQKMSYQAVIRDNDNALVKSHSVGMRISILNDGSPVYVETHVASTNANGLVTIEIGGGTPVTGSFTAIDWSLVGSYSIKTETDPTGGTNYTAIVGTSPLLSVPYALYSKKTASYSEIDPVFVAWDKSAGISIPSSQVTDFQTSVTNNSTVLANTAKISYPAADASKLAGIAAGAEVNVNADWNAATGDAEIFNKPTIPTTTSQLTNNSGFLTSFAETDPVFSGLFNISALIDNQLLKYNSGSGKWENWTPDFLTGFTEVDPIWTAASANYYTKTQTDAGFALISHLHADATTTVSGFLTGVDKTKLDGLQNADGSETKLVSGTNVSISGTGTTSSPYAINSINSGWALTGNSGTIDGTNFIGTIDDKPLDLRVYNQTRLFLSNESTLDGRSYGKVGINTKTPAQLFHIKDTEIPDNGLDDDDDGLADEIGHELVFTSYGRLGINTTSPSATLDLAGTIRAQGTEQYGTFTFIETSKAHDQLHESLLTISNYSNIASSQANIKFDAGNPGHGRAIISATHDVSAGTLNGNLTLKVRNESGNYNDAINIRSSGNVGIGQTNPAFKLDVDGTIASKGFVLPTGAVQGNILTSDVSGNASWQPAAGTVPVGAVVAWLKDLSGTPSLPTNFAECNGQTISDAESPLNGVTLPNLSNKFLMGSTSSGGTGGAPTHGHGGSIAIPSADFPVVATTNLPMSATSPAGHTHTLNISSASNIPPYYTVVWIIRIK